MGVREGFRGGGRRLDDPRLRRFFQRRSWTKAVACLAITSVAGCSLIQPFPKSPSDVPPATNQAPPRNPQATFEDAILYAMQAQRNYRAWLENQTLSSLWLGVGALALAGAALGLGTVGGQTEAVAATGTAGGTLVALDQWVIGSPSKDPKYKAYASGMTQIQCVIDAAWAEKPRVPDLRPQTNNPPMTVADTVQTLRDQRRALETVNNNLSRDIVNCPASSDIREARLVYARAVADQDRAQSVEMALANAPREIVTAVDAIDTSAFVQAQAGGPDIANLPKVSSIASKPPAAGAAPAVAAHALPPPAACSLQASMKAVVDPAKALERSLAGVVPAQPGFAQCIKPPPSPSDTSTTGTTMTSAATKSTQETALKVLPGLQLLAKPKGPQSISISGGRLPYDLIVVDPGLEVAEKSGGSSAGTEVQLTVESVSEPRRLLVTDASGAQLLVTVESAEAAAP